MNAKLLSILVALPILAVAAQDVGFRTLEPVDISAFGKQHVMQASVKDISTSVCRVMQDGTFHSYDVNISGAVSFENHSRENAILYKRAFVLTARMAASLNDLASGRFISGFDGDRIAISGLPEQVSMKDFALIRAGKTYTSTVRTMVPLFMRDSIQSDPQSTGTYWVQLGLDARPDAFYYDTRAQTEFSRRWRNQGELIEFVLTKPFSLYLILGPNTPVCEG